MIQREISRAELQGALGDLLEDATLVTITPLQNALPWAVEAAWAIAARAAFSDRRVALVDLSVERPALSYRSGDLSEEGITDAFMFGASLSHVAEPQETPGFHFIPVGTPPSKPEDVWSSDRWQRLVNGFASQGALLLLYAPEPALQRLPTMPDLAILLSEGEYGIPDSIATRCREAIVVVPDDLRPRLDPTPISGEIVSSGANARPPAKRVATLVLGTVSASLLLALAFAVVFLGKSNASPDVARAFESGQGGDPTSEAATTGGDSLLYSVQVAAFSSADEALASARRYEERGHVTTVSAVRLGSAGLWYRLLVGVYSTPVKAEAGLTSLWKEGLLPRPNGTILRTPAAFDLGGYDTRQRAAAALSALRERGVAGYVVEIPNGTFRILTGAFESAEQANPQDSILRTAGLVPRLVTRVGHVR